MKRGTIEERDGRFRVRISVRGKRVSGGTFDTRAEAAAMLDALRASAAEIERTTSTSPTLFSYGERWLDAREIDQRVRGIEQERSVWRTSIASHDIALFALDEIKPRDVRAWLRDTRRRSTLKTIRTKDAVESTETSKTLSRQSVIAALRLLRGVLGRAVIDELIRENPADGDFRDELPTAARDRDPWTYLTAPEISALLACERIPEAIRLMYAVAIYTGLRQGELWGLDWDDVHETGARPELHVKRSHGSATKSGKPRHVPLLPGAVAALKRLRALRTSRRGDRPVFPTRDGSRRRPGDDGGWADRHSKKTQLGHKSFAGITRKVRFHDLRHTCASHLLMGTWGRAWRLEEVRDMLGHSSIVVTQRYAHLSSESLHSAAAATVPSLPQEHLAETANRPVFMGARNTGFEPVTFGFGERGEAPVMSNTCGAVGSPGDRALSLAREVLRMAAAQSPHVLSRAIELAEAVLEHPRIDGQAGAEAVTVRRRQS